MSQLLEPPMAEQQHRLSGEPSAPAGFAHSLDPAESEFAYRPVPMSAIVGLVLALLSISALMAWMSIPLAAVAAIVCLAATVRIARSQGEFAGLWLAAGGLILSTTMGVAGTLLTIHRYATEMPPGYQRISFAYDISAKGVGRQESNGRLMLAVPPDVEALEGKSIYLKGFMYPTGRPYQLTQFILCKDNGQCCFGGQPALQDMIGVQLLKNLTTDHTPALVGVAGKLKLNRKYTGGDLEPIYLLEAEYVAPALTSL